MIRERVLKAVLLLSGVVFVAGLIPLIMLFSREPAVAMIMSLYVPMEFLSCSRYAIPQQIAA